MTPPPIDVQAVHAQLALHARSLKALARSLIGDEHLADDVVQESFARTLAARPRPGPLGGWLATLVRNLARNEKRTRLRTAEREQRAVRTDLAPTPDDVVARRESLRHVVDAVLSLDEPYQSAILLRYFDELSPGEIAARTGANVATVKSRLARGLERLRRQLDRSHGDRSKWMRALAVAFGLRFETPAAALAAGVIAMGTGTKLALSVAAVAFACALAWKATRRESSAAIIDAPATVALAIEPASPAISTPAKTSDRASIGADQVGEEDDDTVAFLPDLEHPFGFDLLVTVLDHLGLPIDDVTLYLAPEHCAINRWPVRTGADGTVRIAWRGKRSSMEIALLAHSKGIASPMRRLRVTSGAPLLVTLGAESDRGGQSELQVAVVLPDITQRLDYGLVDSAAVEIELVARHRDAFGNAPEAQALLHPRARFGDALLRAQPEPVDPVEEALRVRAFTIVRQRLESIHLQLELKGGFSRSMSLAAGTAFDLRRDLILLQPPTVTWPSLEGVVLGEDGALAKGVPVVCGTAIDGKSAITFTDDDGAFRIDGVPSDWIEVRAGGGDGGLARTRLFARNGETLRWEARLTRGLTIRGRALDAAGGPLHGWKIETEAFGWYDRCVVREDGSFELPNQPGGVATLLLWPGDGGLPLWIERGVLPESGEIVVQVGSHGGVDGALSVLLLAPPAFADLEAEVRVWQEESGRGAFLQHDGETGRFTIEHLPAGWYRVEATAAPCGWIDLGRHWIDGEGLVDLGTVALSEPARVRIVRDAAQLPEDSNEMECQLYARRGDVDVRCEDVSIALESELALPEGDYWFLWRDRSKVRRGVAFSVDAGAVLELDTRAPPR